MPLIEPIRTRSSFMGATPGERTSTFVDCRSSAIVTGGIGVPGAALAYSSVRRRTSLAKCKPQALHSVRAPSGPRRHSGVSLWPHEWHTPGAGARLRFRYFGTWAGGWLGSCVAAFPYALVEAAYDECAPCNRAAKIRSSVLLVTRASGRAAYLDPALFR